MKIRIDKKILILIFIAIATPSLIFNYFSHKKSNQVKISKKTITVFKDPTCACCEGYIAYLKKEGFDVKVVNTNDLLSIKEKYKIPPNFQSCHTAIIDNYFIEGHVPVEAINKLLREKPNVDGISLPEMPPGSPGMGGEKKGLFEIYSLIEGRAFEFGKF